VSSSAQFDAVLFDLGGVWLQDGDFSERSRWAEQRGLTSDELFATYLTAVGPGWEGGRTEEMIHRDLLDRLGVDESELGELLRVLHAHETLDPTITEFVTEVGGAVKIGVITNAGPSARRELWAKFPFDELTDLFVVSAEEGMSKPDPRIYLSACDRLGVEPRRAVLVDDKHRNVVGAQAVGMHAIEFTSPTDTVSQLRALLEIR